MDLNIWMAFGAGVASFISPCCLPLYPSYLSYMSGVSVQELQQGPNAKVRAQVMLHTLFFVLGFSLVFYTLGIGAAFLGGWFQDYRAIISKLSAILIIVMGLFLLGVFRPQWMMRERKLQLRKQAGFLGSLLIGIGFSAGWSPCVGPILGAIVSYTVAEPSRWFALITAYTLGFAVPFFAFSFFLSSARWLLRYSGAIMKVGGVLMIAFGILLYTGQMMLISSWLYRITPQWLLF